MEKFLTSSKGSLAHNEVNSKKRPRLPSATVAPPSTALLLPVNGGIVRQNKSILSDLNAESNVITTAKNYDRIQSVASGHQGGGGGAASKWVIHRTAKLKKQGAEKKSNLFDGVVAYINGYTGSAITNLALIALVQEHGGEIRYHLSAACTHIFNTSGLAAKKTQAFLSRSSSTRVIRPEWAIESVKYGKRQDEAKFSVLTNETQESMHDILGVSPAISQFADDSDQPPQKKLKVTIRHVSAYESPADLIFNAPHRRNHSSLIDHSKPAPEKATGLLSAAKHIFQPTKVFAPTEILVLSPTPSPEPCVPRYSQSLPSSSSSSDTAFTPPLGEGGRWIDEESGGSTKEENGAEEDEEEELDEWGIPPSAQRQTRR